MASIPLKPGYGPTLGELLSPRWRRVSRPLRALAVLGLLLVVVVIVALAARLGYSTFSHQGKVPFHFHYKQMQPAKPDPGDYVKLVRYVDGHLEDSFAVRPLRLGSYQGYLSGELPIYASGYIRRLHASTPGFVLRGDGKTRINTVPGYEVFYTMSLGGREMYGRTVFLFPERPGVRDGVEIDMLTSPRANAEVTSPLQIASAGVLNRPLHSFTFG